MASPNAPSGIAEVNKLAELIVASVKDVVSEYEAANSDIPVAPVYRQWPVRCPALAVRQAGEGAPRDRSCMRAADLYSRHARTCNY